MKTGLIRVTEGHIEVEYGDEICRMSCSGPRDVTVEAILDSVRILCGWMDLPYEEVGNECKLVHYKDQVEAELKEMLSSFIEGIEEEE